MTNKPNALIFYTYLPPWRIDVFNEMGRYYNLTIAFTDADRKGFTYDRKDLIEKLKGINTIFLEKGFQIGSRPVRFGLFSLIKKTKPSIVFSHEYSPTSLIIALFHRLRLFKSKYIITTSDNVDMAAASKGLKAMSRKFVLDAANGIVVYSESVKMWYQRYFPHLQIKICPNIQNPQTLLKHREHFNTIMPEHIKKHHLDGFKIMLYVGRLVHEKGLDLLLQTFSKTKNSEYKLILVGEGDEKENLEKLADNLHIKDRVIFAGYYSGADLYAWYDIANFFVLPSRYEPFGAVVNEALVFGCPTVVSKYIGALDFINELNGIVFDPLHEESFLDAFNRAIKKYQYPETTKRPNLMPVRFDEYVKSFNTILA